MVLDDREAPPFMSPPCGARGPWGARGHWEARGAWGGRIRLRLGVRGGNSGGRSLPSSLSLFDIRLMTPSTDAPPPSSDDI